MNSALILLLFVTLASCDGICSSLSSHQGRKVLIFGASSGIGRDIGEAFVREGAHVAFTSRSEDKLKSIVAQFPAGNAFALKCDVSDQLQIKSTVAEAAKILGGIDTIVYSPLCLSENCSQGGGTYLSIVNVSYANFLDTMNINVYGFMLAVHEAESYIRQSKNSPSIIAISSIAGIGTYPAPMYSVSKHTLDAVVKQMAIDFGPAQIRVNAVNPGYIDTPLLDFVFGERKEESIKEIENTQYPLKRIGKMAEVSSVVLFLASSSASFMTGNSIAIDGGSLLLHKFSKQI